jgi:predicted Zn-dependent protease
MLSPNDSDRFYHDQPTEEDRMDEANRECREIAEQVAEQEAEMAYMEWIDSMLHAFYETEFPDTEWDVA